LSSTPTLRALALTGRSGSGEILADVIEIAEEFAFGSENFFALEPNPLCPIGDSMDLCG
jgi:hypothetical protein